MKGSLRYNVKTVFYNFDVEKKIVTILIEWEGQSELKIKKYTHIPLTKKDSGKKNLSTRL